MLPLSREQSCFPDNHSYRKTPRSLQAARFGFSLFHSLWNLTVNSAAALPRCMSNSRAIWFYIHETSNLAASETSRVLVVRRLTTFWIEVLLILDRISSTAWNASDCLLKTIKLLSDKLAYVCSKLHTRLHIDGLVQEIHNSITNALELRLSCINTSIWSPSVV